ncbi:MAG: hypothetical protein IJF92_02070 [Bacilli bacterium]|nr:hypothetical protein [Bacilli bacterium]
MNFDFSWFLTVPGILITGGVLLLIVALIILIATSGKKNSEYQEVVEENSADANGQVAAEQNMEAPMPEAANANAVPEMGQPQVNPNDSIMNIPDPVMAAPAPEMNPVEPAMDVNPVAQEQPAFDPQVANVEQPVGAPSMEPVVEQPAIEPVQEAPSMEPVVEQPAIEPVQEAPSMEPVVEQPAIELAPETPSMEPVVEQPAIQPSPEAPSMEPVINQPTMESNSIPNIDNGVGVQNPTVENVNSNPVVPDVSNVQPQQEQPQIYGGANPLENTQSIPISNIVGPNANQAPVQTPSAEPTMVDPQIQPVQPNIQQ